MERERKTGRTRGERRTVRIVRTKTKIPKRIKGRKRAT